MARSAVPAGHDVQARHHGFALDRRGAREEREHRPGPEPARGGLLGPRAQLAEPRHGDGRGDEEARPAGGDRPLSVGDRGDVRDGAQGRRLPAAGGDAARRPGQRDRLQPLAAVAREGDRPAVRVAHRPHDHVPARAEARLRRPASRQARRQAEHQAREGQGRHGRARHRGHHARVQPRLLDHRLHRPVARAAAGAHAQHARLRREDAARRAAARTRRPATTSTGDYFGLPWPCYGTAAIKHPGSPNLYDTTRHVMDGGNTFRANFGVEKDGVNLLAEDGVAFQGLGDHHRLPRVRPRAPEEARLVGRAHRARKRPRPRAGTGRPTSRAASSAWR